MQVLKSSMRRRIQVSALRCFADTGYGGTTIARIATAAGTAPANVYRYFPSKQALFDDVVPDDLVARHDSLLDSRIRALGAGGGDRSATAGDLLDFWLQHRFAVVVLLDRAAGTRVADYPEAFVARLVEQARRYLPSADGARHEEILTVVFDNTRRAIARILFSAQDEEHARRLVQAFWTYQEPGLGGLLAHLRSPVPGADGSRGSS